MARTDTLGNFLTDVATAIRTKGGTSETIQASQFDTAIANLPSGGGGFAGLGREVVNGKLQLKSGTFSMSDIGNATIIGSHILEKIRYSMSDGLTAVNLSDVTWIENYGMNGSFYGCFNITNANFHSLNEIENYGMYECFNCCPIQTIDFSRLSSIGSYGMQYCFVGSSLTSVSFPSLIYIFSNGLKYCFQNSTSLQSIYFSSNLRSVNSKCFDSMLSGVTGCTVHFPASMQSTIESMASALAGFGGTNTTILFDL